MFTTLPRDAIHSALRGLCCRALSVCLSRWCIETANLLSNFFIAWWPHHSSFPKGTVKFRRGHPQQGRQIEVWYTKNLRFSTNISEIPIPIPNIEVFQNTDTEYRTDMKKIPTKIPNTDTDSKYRYRPSSTTDTAKNTVYASVQVSLVANWSCYSSF